MFSTVGDIIYQDIPHIYHDIPHGTQDIPHDTHDISHGTEHPHGTEQLPRYCTHITQGDSASEEVAKQIACRKTDIKVVTEIIMQVSI